MAVNHYRDQVRQLVRSALLEEQRKLVDVLLDKQAGKLLSMEEDLTTLFGRHVDLIERRSSRPVATG